MSEWDNDDEVGDEEEYLLQRIRPRSWWHKVGFSDMDIEFLEIKTSD